MQISQVVHQKLNWFSFKLHCATFKDYCYRSEIENLIILVTNISEILITMTDG